MLNFKQYLQEDINTHIHFVINFKFANNNNDLDQHIHDITKNEYIKKMKELGNSNIIELFFGSKYTFPYLIVELNKSYSQIELKSLAKKCVSDLQQIMDEELTTRTSQFSIVVRQLNNPNFEIEWPESIVINPTQKTSLKNVNKILKTEQIYVHNIKNISDSVLGLLKFKKLYITNKDETEWSNILLKYKDTRDILACQDELLENGLKDFAKL